LIERLARRKTVEVSTLVRMWVMERMRREAIAADRYLISCIQICCPTDSKMTFGRPCAASDAAPAPRCWPSDARLGIGGAAAVFTIAHTVLLAPPPYRDPDRIVSSAPPHRRSLQGVSQDDFLDYRRESSLFESSALTSYAEFSWTGQSLPGFDGPRCCAV